jgi:hypothetical protein
VRDGAHGAGSPRGVPAPPDGSPADTEPPGAMGIDIARVWQAIRAAARVPVAQGAGAARRLEPAVENSETPGAAASSLRPDALAEEPVVLSAEREAVSQPSRSGSRRHQRRDASPAASPDVQSSAEGPRAVPEPSAAAGSASSDAALRFAAEELEERHDLRSVSAVEEPPAPAERPQAAARPAASTEAVP